jgi:prephenate dehydratase
MSTTIGYQGEPGAYSEEAAGLLYPGAELRPYRALRQVFEGVESGALDAGVVPVENSQAGSINETYDLLAPGAVHIVGEAVIRVDHALLALPGTRIVDVTRVASHPAALAQCQEFLATLDAEVVPVYDTAGAAKRIADERRAGEAAVAGERAGEVYGLEALARKIQDDEHNFTRFAAVAADPEPLGPPDKTSLVLVTDHRPGALFHALRPFAERGVNLVKLESRPSGAGPWKYRFYLDVEVGHDDSAFQAALEDLRTEAAAVQVLGSYPRWREPTESDLESEWSTKSTG